ncbi:hypothetical protein Poli38472_000751 [Pythium oligandrum]|uniref:Paladin n=1 Tax=Pythium oligandrum TaxID=41045 RepID=A0A8K1CCV2_PYTOL|nr:hypothetical protein Poli38472_000751 [Pythium oligandrum]|eukprot:TMW60709.1 hypothetical protein Poli38472_000751 [Pythium oligandrum]
MDTKMEEVDALLASVAAQAQRVKDANDPQYELKELLEPVRSLIVQILAEKDGPHASGSVDPSRIKAHHDQSEAATKIQALVRGTTQRGQLKRQISFHLQGTKVLNNYVLKRDRFPNCHVLDTPDGDHAPNFRRLDGAPLYGCAQPTMQGIQQILQRVADDGFTNVVWINLREEAVIYVDGTPYTARRSAKLNENDLVPGITGHTVQVLETSMKKSLQEQLALSDERFEYWHEVALHDNVLKTLTVDPATVHTLPELYELEAVNQAGHQLKSIRYYRIPIERENAPEHTDLERLMTLMNGATSDTAFVFNCQMGKRRTTTALVIASLIWQLPHLVVHGTGTPRSSPRGRSTSVNGDFAVIRELEMRLRFGKDAKAWVDKTIDQCSAICNIRTVIHEYHESSTSEAKPAKRTYYLHHALSFLERYFYLIVFGAYLLYIKQQHNQLVSTGKKAHPGADAQSFSKWLQHHPNLFRLLDDLGGVKYKSDKILQSSVLKFDHFIGIARIPFELTTNVPNYRQIADEPIFGSAQCLEDGIRDIAQHCLRNGFERAICINLREEAVIYVSGRPFVIRHPDRLMENVEYPGIEVSEIMDIEHKVKEEIQSRVQRANGLFMFWHEPVEFKNEEKIEHINPHQDIKTLNEIYEEVAEESGFDLRYARIPVSDETAPEEKDLDDMVRLLLPAFTEEFGLEIREDQVTASEEVSAQKRTAVFCNCQMGRGRTTTALVCIFMIRLALHDVRVRALDSNEQPSSTLERVLEIDNSPEETRRQSSSVKGDFLVIRKLCETLSNGPEAKRLVDYAVDKCEHLQNLRECIAQCRNLAMDRELSSAKHDTYMLRAVNYLERYFYLICFASYVLEERVHLFQRTLFVTWMNERYGSALYALLDNLFFEEDVGAEIHVSSMRWRWRRKRKLISRLE